MAQEIRGAALAYYQWPGWLKYGVAIVAVAVAAAVSLTLKAELQSASYTSLFFCAIVFAAWFGGLGPGLMAIVLADLAFDYFFLEPTRSLTLYEAGLLSLVVFTVAASLVVMLAAAQRRLTIRLQNTRAELQSAISDREAVNRVLLSESVERQRAEQNSRRAERELQLIIDCIPVIAARYDRDGRIDFVNQTWRAYTGTTLETADRHRWGVAIHPDDASICESSWRAGLAAGQSFQLEHRLRRADGVFRWFRVIRVPFRDESQEVVRWYAAAYDIEDSRRAFELLRRSGTYLEVAQQLSRTGSLGWDIAARTVFWSKHTFNILGFDETVPPSLDLLIERTHPDDRDFVRHQLASHAHGQHDFDFEHRLLMDNGEVRHVHVRARRERYSSDTEEILGAVMDITDAKKAQAALGRVQAELAHANRVASLGEMSASIAHEVNQPLSAIAINGEVLLRLLSQRPPNVDESMIAAEQIVGDVHRATHVMHWIRELSRKAQPEMIRLDLNSVVKDAVEVVRREALQADANVRLLLAETLPAVRGDRIQLQQVILNLSLNGLQAMASILDGRLLTIRTQSHNDSEVLVTVEDVGMGVDEEGIDHLFDPFFTTKKHGLGIGLSICRSITEAHGGKIWASRNLGPGMTFSFTVPLDP